MNNEIRVLVVDDSVVGRQVMSAFLNAAPGIQVIGAVSDPRSALERMRWEWPDVIALSVEMPRMDGLAFLKRLMAEHPTPVVACASLTRAGAEITLQALAAGAVSIIVKPTPGLTSFLRDGAADMAAAVRAAATANLQALADSRLPAPARPSGGPAPPISGGETPSETTERLVAIGTSAGGTQALEGLLTALPRDCPGLVIVQPLPEQFTASFARHLNGLCKIEVLEARDGQPVIPGQALIAPGGKHMRIKRGGSRYLVEILDGALVNRHRPSVDVLFRSVARHAGRNAMGIILSGLGEDGAHGLKEMREAGACTLAQDEASCVVYGMPREAVKLGAVDHSLPLSALAGALLAGGGGS